MKEVNPLHYTIHIEPDLNHFEFSGVTGIMMEAARPIKEITLNAADLAFSSCAIEQGGEFVECPFSIDPEREEITISLSGEMAGKIRVKMEFQGEINARMAGFYRSVYTTGQGRKYAAVTQFQENDARRAFPCFDHPVNKAVFAVEMVIDENLAALSNMPVREERIVGGGRKLVIFEETPRMSTYLLFFGVGEFEFIEDPGEVLLRAATMPGMKEHARFGLAFGRKALEFCEDYYGIKYPLPKLDLIAIQDFAAGAMENWGAITFRENLLLRHEDITSRGGEERICEVIAHEIAHHWFGNLVSPSDWKYLWLNESFATYFGFTVVNRYHPEWNTWSQFLHAETDRAFERDALLKTFPIELPGEEPVVINVSTSPIIYNKGASILRQVEGYIGTDTFREGLRHYLKKHAYACASSQDLWRAFEEISGGPITRMMKSWVEQPGFPLLEVKQDGTSLLLTQKRFTCLPNTCRQDWLIPVTVKVFYDTGTCQVMKALMEGETARIDIGQGAAAYKVNYGQTGFYRVKYHEEKNLQEMGRRVARKELPPEDRWGIQNDFYALCMSGDISVDGYLDFLFHFAGEDAFLPLISIAANLSHAYLVMDGARRERVAATGKSLFERALSTIGYEPDPAEQHTVSMLRDQILYPAVLYGSEAVKEFVLQKFTSLMKGGAVHRDILKSVMQAGALHGNEEVFAWLDRRFKSSPSEDERVNILVALGGFRERTMIEKVQHYTLHEVPERNRFIPVRFLSANQQAIPFMWEWYVASLPLLEQLHPDHYERVIESIVPVCGLAREEEVRAFFSQYVPKKESTRDVIRLSLEKLDINTRMRARSETRT